MRCDTDKGKSSSATAAATVTSFSGLAKENSREIAMASGAARRTASRSRANSASDGRCKARPSQSIRSSTPKRNSRATSGVTRSKKKSYSRGRACLPISIVSSNPAVVISATRAPFRCSRALVPTVVPCNKVRPAPVFSAAPPIFFSASPIAREGSSGVENTFRVRSVPPSTQTQSVNVPPVSMAMRSSGCRVGTMNREDYHCPRSVPKP